MGLQDVIAVVYVLTASLILIGLGVLGTFPIFFQAFAPAE